MKKFFRALALVLALVLVIGTVPATQASAKVKKSKTLYVGGAQGESKDGELKSAIKGKVALYKLAGYTSKTKKGHEISAKIKSGKDIVDVTSKYVVAEAFGKAVVTLTVDGVKHDVVINVKANATDKTLTVEGLEKTAVVGVEYEVALPRAGKDSDERRLFTDATEGVTIKDGASARKYLVTFTKAGTYTLTAEAFQSEALDAATATKTIEVTAKVPAPASAKQISATKFEVTFDGKMTGIIDKDKISNNDIYYLVGETHIVTGVVKSVTVDKDDATKVVIESYTAFKEGETYYFAYGDAEPVSFKSAVNSAANIDTIKLVADDHYYVNKEGTVALKYYNADGVELTVDTVFPTITITSGNEYAYMTGANKVTFFAVGAATIKAVVILGYDENNNYKEISREDTITIAGTEEPPATLVSSKYSFGQDASKEVHYILMGETKELKIEYKDSKNVTTKFDSSVDTIGVGAKYVIKSANESIAMIKNGKVEAVNTGNTTIILYEIDNKGNEVAKAAYPIEVKAAAKGAEVTAAFKNNQTTLNISGTATAVLEVAAKDQYGNAYTNIAVTYKQVANNAKVVGATLNESKTLTNGAITFGAADFTLSTDKGTTIVDNGTASVVFTVTVKDAANGATLLTKNLTLVVAKADTATGNTVYRLVSDKTTLDNSIKNYADGTKAQATATVKIETYKIVNGAQFSIGVAPATIVKDLASVPATNAAGTYNYIIPTVKAKVNVSNVAEGATISQITISNFVTPTTPAAVDLYDLDKATTTVKESGVAVTGTYSFTAIQAKYGTDTKLASREQLGTVTVVVGGTDAVATYTEQSGLTAAKIKDAIATGTGYTDLFKVTWDGLNTKDNAARVSIQGLDAKVDTETGAVYVYTIFARVLPFNGFTDYVDLKVTVGKLYKD